MAVAPTGAIYKALKFDGVSSRTYGVYITGAAVYNAPERDVEMIAIPGRNGSFALDKGRFENIEVSYPAGIFADAESDFAEAVSDFRNFLCSRNGYVRLQDEYNPNEYRMAVYKSGLEVDPALLRAGEFEIVFECKPQRYLTSGETAIKINSGVPFPNLTNFDSWPTLEVEGGGNITIGDKTITLMDGTVGYVVLSDETRTLNGQGVPIDTSLVKDTDNINISNFMLRARFQSDYADAISSVTFLGPASPFSAASTIGPDGKNGEIYISASSITMNKGDVLSDTFSATFTAGANTVTAGLVLTVGFTSEFVFSARLDIAIAQPHIPIYPDEWQIEQMDCQSTETKLGHPTYIDCEIGEAYKIVNGVYISLNRFIDLGSELPKLSPGVTRITFDNTITELKIVPHFWKV